MKFLQLLPLALLAISCVSQNVEELSKASNNRSLCDTVDVAQLNITYREHIVPLLQKNCISCHSAVKAAGYGGGKNWEDSAFFANYAITLNKVLPAIRHTGPVTMPRDAPRLSECDINTVARWIELNQ